MDKLFQISCAIFVLISGLFFAHHSKAASPHNYSDKLPGIYCLKCHKNKPDLKGNRQGILSNIKLNYDRGCQGCHKENIPGSCLLASQREITANLIKQIFPFPLPLFQGCISCISCHKIHQPPSDQGPFLLKPSHRDFLKASEAINPHQTGIFCLNCHEQEPSAKDKQLYVKYNGNIVDLCRSCHNNQRAKADNHPVNLIPCEKKGIKIPEAFPLYEGKITCLTCHILPCQGETGNQFYLRGGPYQRRIDTCLTCHIREQLQKDNPHDQLTDTGDIREDRCLFCHEINKENSTGLAFKFKASFNFYCLGCHPIQVEKHPFGAHHTGLQLHTIWGNLKPSERTELSQQERFKMFPLTISGKIMCATCHNPHDTRKGPKLRINDVNKSCRQCHYKKYGQIIQEEKTCDQWLPRKKISEMPIGQTTPSKDDLKTPKEDAVPFGFRASLQYYCIGCHANKETDHPFGIMHTGRFIKRFWKSRFSRDFNLCNISEQQILPLTLSGQIGCFTCHNPHNQAKGPKLRVESKKQLCNICHPNRSKTIDEYLKKLQPQDPNQ